MLPWILFYFPVWRFGLRPIFKHEEDLSEDEDFVRPHCEEGPEPKKSHLGVINVHGVETANKSINKNKRTS